MVVMNVIDKWNGDEIIKIKVDGDTICMDTKLETHNGKVYNNGNLIFEMYNNIIIYLNENYEIRVEFI